jgi:type I restriction-modification system DNA methylase subunit
MSEELAQKGLTEHGLIIGSYEFYNIGSSTLNQLKICKIVPNKDYKEYGIRKPDALLVDRRNFESVRVLCVIEGKPSEQFDSEQKRTSTIEQCNDLCQVLDAPIGIATDYNSFVWFNPKQNNPSTEYSDRTTGAKRSYTLILDANGTPFSRRFLIDQQNNESDILKLLPSTRDSLESIEEVRNGISQTSSQLMKPTTINPTDLARQIWQDVWFVTGATPEKSLYTFLELFIFKYLSDLGILTEDSKGNQVSFNHIFSLGDQKAFKNYHANVRPHLKAMFPEDSIDHTTIINGTVLNPEVPEHDQTFYRILKRFYDFGVLRNIDPSFKSKVFEAFMKESISSKNLGQHFTPRNVVDAMISISDIEKLEEGSKVCDPACGVGGFILEPMKVQPNGVNFYYRIEGNKILPRYKFIGYDKGFEKEDQLTIILAKANMLIFLSDFLKKNPSMSKEFAYTFNSTFKLLSTSILGTLALTTRDFYDLILTNPPFVVRGSSNYKDAIKSDARLRDFYQVGGLGVETLFLQWIIQALKPSKKGFVIVPEGIFNRLHGDKLRKFIRDECFIDGIISLPRNTFYRNPQKTYILAMTKKPDRSSDRRVANIQTDPVFTYLVSNIGETLDVRRFPIDENDLNEMVSLFNQFKGAKTAFTTRQPRCKIQPISKFAPEEYWSVDRWWTKEEKIGLGIEEEDIVLTLAEFKEQVNSVEVLIHKLNEDLRSVS